MWHARPGVTCETRGVTVWFAVLVLSVALLASAFLSIALLYLGVEVELSMLPNAWWSSPFIVLRGNKVVGVCGAPPCPGLGPCGIGQLHPVHPCFTAQLLCAVLLRSQDRNRLRTPGKHHLIIHHHLCRESRIPAADLSKNSSNKYQGDFGSYRQRTLPRRLCGQDSPSSALRDLSH